jgi:hypothetical protein
MARPGRGFKDLERKGFCSPPPEDWQELACRPHCLSLFPLQGRKCFLFLPRPDGGLAGPMVAPGGPGSHASPPFNGLCWGGPCQSLGPGHPGNVHLFPSLDGVAAREGTLGAMACASRPAADWLGRSRANEEMSFVVKCAFTFPLQRTHLWPPCHPLCPSSPQKKSHLKVPEKLQGPPPPTRVPAPHLFTEGAVLGAAHC